VGLTGAPGAGKSTLTDRLISVVRAGWPSREAEVGRERVDQVAVVAVDPSSPFTGGAILGDRIRMQEHASDPSVFIRSMATRGHLGGLALAVPDAVRVLGAAGVPVVIVETTVVVVTPGWGDSMQASKAGLLEVADLFVINKADRPGVREARRDLEQMLDLSTTGEWRPPVVETVAVSGEGVEELWGVIARHRAYLYDSGALEDRRTARLAQELRRVVMARLLLQVEEVDAGEGFAEAVAALVEGRLDPYQAADRLLDATGPEPAGGKAPRSMAV
jgi:LAO/AO transport system kinase